MIRLIHSDSTVVFDVAGVFEYPCPVQSVRRTPVSVAVSGASIAAVPWRARCDIDIACIDACRLALRTGGRHAALVDWIIHNVSLPGPRESWPHLRAANGIAYDWDGRMILDAPISPI